MKIVALGEAKNELSSFVDQSQKDRVLITRHGRPAALMIGVEGEDLEDLLTSANPRFWELIEERRKNPDLISAHDMQERYGLGKKTQKIRKTKKT